MKELAPSLFYLPGKWLSLYPYETTDNYEDIEVMPRKDLEKRWIQDQEHIKLEGLGKGYERGEAQARGKGSPPGPRLPSTFSITSCIRMLIGPVSSQVGYFPRNIWCDSPPLEPMVRINAPNIRLNNLGS
jgi:hypothetical protein